MPGPNQIVTTINLEHVLTLSPGAGYSPFVTDILIPEKLHETAPSYATFITKGKCFEFNNTSVALLHRKLMNIHHFKVNNMRHNIM